jgi:hypothetical protein
MLDLLNLIRWMLLGLVRSKSSLEAEVLAVPVANQIRT